MLFAGGHLSPDAGGSSQIRQPGSEGFNGEPAVVADALQTAEGRFPIHMVFAGGGAVVGGDVDMIYFVAANLDGIGQGLFFNVVKDVVREELRKEKVHNEK